MSKPAPFLRASLRNLETPKISSTYAPEQRSAQGQGLGFRTTLGTDVTTIRLPAKSPNLNAYAERFVLSIKSECLNHVVPLGERHLRLLVIEFVAHYHIERTHQGLGNELIVKHAGPANDNGSVKRRKRLGGMLNYYHRDAA